MDAWVCAKTTGVDDLVWDWVPTPPVRNREVLVEIRAASLNFPDLLMVQGQYQMTPELPFVPGAEFAGRIIGSADEYTLEDVRIGQDVCCVSGTGAFASHAIVHESMCVPIPPNVRYVDAACMIMTYGTAYHALYDRAQLEADECVLILGAAGGVGTAAIQLARLGGARVIAAASTDAKCSTCRQQGADHVINTSREDLRARLKELTGGAGPDVIVDPVGGRLTEQAFRSIAWRGRHLVIGFAAGDIPSIPLNLALLKGASLIGVFWGDYAKRERLANLAMMRELFDLYLKQKIAPVIDTTVRMQELKEAFTRLQTRQVRGKIVLKN